jgi:DNA-binding NarL/FixJ family response regulator
MAKGISAKVLLIDEHPIFLMGLSSFIKSIGSFAVVGEAVNIADAINIAKKEKPQLVITEIRFGDEFNIDLIPQLKSIDPEVEILILTMCEERFFSERFLRTGARGFIMKKESASEIAEAIKTVLNRKVYLSKIEKERILEAMADENTGNIKDWSKTLRKLSDREFQVFSLIGKGYGTLEIASKFNISAKTIDTHKEHIKLKLHCNTSLEVRQMAIEWANSAGAL